MKKKIVLFVLFGAACFAGKAQNLLGKVPSNVSLVIKYSGDNLSKNVPLKKLDSYNFVRNNLYKALKVDSLTSLESTGINFDQDAYQYVTMEDSSINFTSLFAIKNVQDFLKLVQAHYSAEMKPEKRNGFEFLSISDDAYVGWNDKQAVLVYSSYQNKKSYYDYSYPTSDTAYMTDSTVAAMDSVVMLVDTTIKFTPPKITKDKPSKKQKGPVKGKGKTAAKGKKGKGKKPAPKLMDEEVVTDEIVQAPVEENSYTYDTTGQAEREAKREAWEKEQRKYAAAKQKKLADSIANSFFNGTTTSIETEASYKKIIDPSANVTAWVNYDNLLYQYWNFLFRGFHYSPRRYYDMEPRNFNNNENNGFRSGMNLYFEKDKMRLDQKMYAPDEKIAALGREVYNSKQSNSLAGYINPGNLAYLSASINTEAMANYYYKLIRQYLNSYPYTREYSEVIDVYMDFMEIIIDEKAIAELMPGNMVMVLHDLKTKTVTYTDYVYDDDFKSTEVKKTKEELAPNFTFVMETKKDAFLKKIANLPLKYAEKEKFNYKEKGGYYELAFEEGKYPLSSLYFMVKDGKAIVTTSKEVIDMTLNNTGYTLDAGTKNSILNNNVSLKIDTKKLIQQINPELSSDASKKISKYLEDNMGDVKMEGGIKDGMMQATTTMSITGNNTNSLEFFFNMIDSINDIMEKDKQEREKKID